MTQDIKIGSCWKHKNGSVVWVVEDIKYETVWLVRHKPIGCVACNDRNYLHVKVNLFVDSYAPVK